TVSAAVGSGNGSIGPGSQSVDHDGTAGGTLSADTGWSLDTLSGDTCSPVDNGDGTWSAPNITDACAVTATFVIDSYTVSAAVGSGNGSIDPASQSVDHDGTAGGTLSADAGWSLDTLSGDTCSPVDNGDGTWSAHNITDACAVTATFVIDSYTVTGAVDTGNGSITPTSQTVDQDDTATLTVTPDTGWSIDSVSGCGGSLIGDTYTTGSITADCTVTAAFVINTYTVTFVDHDSTVLDTQTVDHGSDATAPTDPTREGYTFTGWDVPFDNVTEDLTVTAEYEIDTYTVTFVDHDTSVLDTQTVEYGSDATAPPDPTRGGYTFTGWDVPFDNVTEDLTVTAEYEIDSYAVTFVDHDSTVLDTQTVEYGSDATAPTDPTREGYTFTGWDVPFDNVTEDLTITAEYEIDTYTVTFVDHDGSQLKEEAVDHGTAATAPADPTRSGYSFTGWDVSFDNVTSDMTVTAQYELVDGDIFSDRFEPAI
uniref:InlB B-repeat-containing protein n=1 Tax=Wenzhouxiangella sp. EGI_FJ10305 TaxID=3243768 RepID=UPI0035DD894E